MRILINNIIINCFKKSILIIFLLLINFASHSATEKDTLIVRNKRFTERNIEIGIIVAPIPGSYTRDAGLKNFVITSFHTIASPYVECFFLKKISVLGSFTFHHISNKDTNNLVSLTGIAGLRYYHLIPKYKNQYNWYIGLLYGQGKSYDMPGWKIAKFHPQGIKFNYGINFHPNRLFKRENESWIFDISFSQQLFHFKNRDLQPFGGIGAKYRF